MATVVLAHVINGSTSANPHTTASFTPAADDLLVVFGCAVASVEVTPTLVSSANGPITFTRVVNQLWGGNDQASAWVANQKVPGGPVSMTVTYDTPNDASSGGACNVFRVAGMTLTGLAAIKQFAQNDSVTIGTAPSVNFASAVNPIHPVIAQVCSSTNPPALTPPTGFTEDGETGWASPTTGIELVHRNAGHSGTSLTWGSTTPSATAVLALELDAGGGVTPATHSKWIGNLTSTSADITSKIEGWGTDTVKVRYSVNSDMSGSSDTSAVAPDARGIVKNSLTGLSANTRYYFKIVVGTTVLDGGDFKTAPSGAASFAFGYASCRNSDDDSTVFSDVLTRTVAGPNALFFLEIGDMHYEDIAVEDSTLRRAAYDEFLSRTNIAIATSKLPMDYTYDDHDSTGNNSNRLDTGWTSVQSVYRERVPHYTLPTSDSVQHTFVIGRVRFIVIDCRAKSDSAGAADGPTKTRLGTVQKAWLIDLLQNSTEPLIFLVSTSPWIGPVAEAGGQDHWGMFPDERTEIAAEIAANGRVVILSGDQHCLALDDGTNSPGGCPVWHAAALNRSVTFKGGPYSHGQSAGGPHQYGFVDVEDDGTTITATYNGIQSDGSTWLQWEFNPNPATLGAVSASFGGTLSASGVPRTFGAAAASFGGTLSAAGVDRALGAAVASFGGTVAAGGVDRTLGAGAASWGFLATAAGTVTTPPVQGSVVAGFGGAFTVAGQPVSSGTAVAVFGFIALVSGESRVLGVASASFGGTLEAQGFVGEPPITGEASALFGGSFAATGHPRVEGLALPSFGFAALAQGRARVLGVVSASFGGTLEAQGFVGDPPATGEAVALFGFTASVAGQARRPGVASASFGFVVVASGGTGATLYEAWIGGVLVTGTWSVWTGGVEKPVTIDPT